MSTNIRRGSDGTEQSAELPCDLESLPEFACSYLYDDAEDPSEVTVYLDAADVDLMTSWITVDCETAVPLEDAR
jgi:hypothetical protein